MTRPTWSPAARCRASTWTRCCAGCGPLISDNWNNLFTWQGVGEMPAAERARLHAFVAQAHADRQRVRFWATPDAAGDARNAIWRELIAANVDHINTDDLPGLETFLHSR